MAHGIKRETVLIYTQCISFSSGTFPNVHAGGKLLTYYTTIHPPESLPSSSRFDSSTGRAAFAEWKIEYNCGYIGRGNRSNAPWKDTSTSHFTVDQSKLTYVQMAALHTQHEVEQPTVQVH